MLDSDKTKEVMDSPNLIKLRKLGYNDSNCGVTKKREIESYIHPDYFRNLTPPIEIEYGDWDDVKKICGEHPMSGRLGGKGVCDRHFLKLTFPLLRKTFCPDGEHDEFLDIYHKIHDMCEA